MSEIKDSGIEWVDKIPVDWEIRPVYYYFDERKNKRLNRYIGDLLI